MFFKFWKDCWSIKLSIIKGFILIHFESSINFSYIMFIMIIYKNFFDRAVNVFIPIIKKFIYSWIFWSLVFCLPYKFVYYTQIIWNIIYYLNGGNCPFLQNINQIYPFPVEPKPPSLSVFLSGCS